jgi:hypothetical protein
MSVEYQWDLNLNSTGYPDHGGKGARGGVVVEALRYKPEDRG